MSDTTDAARLFGGLPPSDPSGARWKPLPAEVFAADLIRSHPRYAVKKLIGQGGMGAVYWAEDT